MRPLKFRAWLGGVIHPEWQRIDDLVYETHPDIKIMQFTGLQDSKGVDVYESDIVKVDNPQFLRCRKIDVIEFRSGAFFIGDSDDMASLHNAQSVGTNQVRLEVIGNVYKNPKLLT